MPVAIDFEPEAKLDFQPEGIDFQPEASATPEKPYDFYGELAKRGEAGKKGLETFAGITEQALKPISAIQKAGAYALHKLGLSTPEQYQQDIYSIENRPRLANIPQQTGVAAQVGAGVGNAVINFVGAFTDPDMLAMIGLGGASAEAKNAVLTYFATTMAAAAPQQLAAATDAFKAKKWQEGVQQLSEGLIASGLSAKLGGELLKKPGIAPMSAEMARLIPNTAEAVKETGVPVFEETGPRAPEVAIVPTESTPAVPTTRETVVPTEQTELETPKPELAPASPELERKTSGKPTGPSIPEPPSRMFHGTRRAGEILPGTGNNLNKQGVWLTSSPDIAKEFAAGRPIDEGTTRVAEFEFSPKSTAIVYGPDLKHTDAAKLTDKGYDSVYVPDTGWWIALTKDSYKESKKGPENAEGIRSDTGQPSEAGKVAETGEVNRGSNVEQAPPVEPEPVGTRSEANERQAPETPKPNELTKPSAPVQQMQEQVTEVAKTENKRSAKEVKDDLIEEIQQRLQKAPAESKPGDTVTIDIPGDGTFTVKNSIEALSGLLERARKLKTDIKPPKITKAQIKASENALRVSWTPRPEPESAPKPPEQPIVGMGGAVPGEFERSAQTATSIKNATVDQERAKLGLPPAMEPAKRSFGEVWDKAMSIVDRTPERQDALIEELKKQPRALTDVEDALLLHRQIDLQNEFAKATRDLSQAFEDGRLADVTDQRARVDYLSDKLLELYDVNKTSGTETGRGLAARKMMAYEDFTLAKMEMEKRAAKGGAPLTDAERTQLQELSKKIEETQKAYDQQLTALQERISQMEAQKVLDEAKAKSVEQPQYEPGVLALAERFAKYMDTQADAARIRLKAKWEKSKRIGIVPEPLDPTMISDAAVIGAAKITRGIAKGVKWADAMAKDIGEWIRPELDKIWVESERLYEQQKKGYFDKLETVEKKLDKETIEKARQATGQAKVQADRETLKARIDDRIKKGELTKVSPMVQKLVRFIVSENPKITRDALIDEVHSVLKEAEPTITRRQAMDAISGYGDFKQLSKDEISKTVRDLKGQMQQVAKIEDIESRKPPLKTGIERREPSNEERRLIKLVNEAKRRFGIEITDPATQLKSALDSRKTYYRNAISDLQAQIDAKQKFVKTKTPSPTDAELENLKAKRDELKKQFEEVFGKPELTVAQRAEMLRKAMERSIAEYERRLKEGDFTPRKPKPFDVSQHPELVRLKALNESAKAEYRKGLLLDRMKRRSFGQKAYDVAKEILNLPRNVLSSWDVSAVLRQGGFIAFGHPVRAAKSLIPMFRAMASDKAAREIETQILSRPNAPLYARAKLYLAPLEDLRLSAQEEQIMSRLAHRIPGLRGSNRAFVTFLNKLRADSFDTMVASLAKDRPLEANELSAIADYINVATGRGNLGKAAAAAETLATVFFSPRLMASRFQLLAGQPLYRGSLRTRAMIAKEYARMLIGLSVVYGLGRMAGGELEEDPRSSDFAKIKFGNTRVDPLMGLAQVTVLGSRLATGETLTASGKIHAIRGNVPYGKATGADVIATFLRTKLSPVVGAGVDVLTGKNVVGEPVTPGTVAARLSVPLSFSDILDIMQENGVERGTALEILSLFGMGVQNYETKPHPR